MATWLQQDVEEARAIAESIRATAVRRRVPLQQRITIRLSESDAFRENLSSTWRALPIRQLSQILGLDEHRPFLWRLEHKLMQALVLDQFCPGHVPLTLGLGRYRAGIPKEELRSALHREFTEWGFYLKPSMGDSSGERKVVDESHIILKDIELGKIELGNPAGITDEAWLLQKRLPIRDEYRVHTIEDRVIHNLTYNRYGRGDIPRERGAPNAYVQDVLDRLPNALVGGSLLGWDVAWLGDRFAIVEVNFCGFHPVHRRGYQCSGYFQDVEWGASMIARLLRFLEREDGIRIDVEADDPQHPGWWFYNKLSKWMPLLRAEGK
jgi:hypothetical protein